MSQFSLCCMDEFIDYCIIRFRFIAWRFYSYKEFALVIVQKTGQLNTCDNRSGKVSRFYPFGWIYITQEAWNEHKPVIFQPTAGMWNHRANVIIIYTFGLGTICAQAFKASHWTHSVNINMDQLMKSCVLAQLWVLYIAVPKCRLRKHSALQPSVLADRYCGPHKDFIYPRVM